MCHACHDCGSPVVPKNALKPWPHRCPACKRAKQRAYNQARAEQRRRTAAHCMQCVVRPAVTPRRGPASTLCKECREQKRSRQSAARKERAKASGENRKHALECHYCGIAFQSARRQQKFCSTACAHTMSRKRSTFVCERCGVVTETCEAYASRRRFCSKECDNASRSLPGRTCAGCGCNFRRAVSERFVYRDRGKYCTRDCYLDHRWGKDRPRKAWSDSVRARASRNALATSLRKKCKILGAPYDAECTRQSVCERDGWQCQRCRVACNQEYIINRKTRRIHPRNAEHDHIIPLTDDESPGNVFPNSQCLCRRCNGKKRDTRWGQLRLDLEGSVQRWEDVDANRSRRNSKSSVAIQAVVP